MATLTRPMKEMIATQRGELYEQAAAMSAKMGMPKPLAVVIIHLTEIHSLKPGPGAGKKIV